MKRFIRAGLKSKCDRYYSDTVFVSSGVLLFFSSVWFSSSFSTVSSSFASSVFSDSVAAFVSASGDSVLSLSFSFFSGSSASLLILLATFFGGLPRRPEENEQKRVNTICDFWSNVSFNVTCSGGSSGLFLFLGRRWTYWETSASRSSPPSSLVFTVFLVPHFLG